MQITKVLLIVAGLAISSTSVRLGAAAQTSTSQQSKPSTQNSANGWAGTITVHWDPSPTDYNTTCQVILTLHEDGTVDAQVEGRRTVSGPSEFYEYVYKGTKFAAAQNGVSSVQPQVVAQGASFLYSIVYSAGSFLVRTIVTHSSPRGTYTTSAPDSTCVTSQPPIDWRQTQDPYHLFGTRIQDTGTVSWDLHRPQFRLLTPNDPKWMDSTYSSPPVIAYFPDTTSSSSLGSSCHNFVGELGLTSVPGANLCSNGLIPLDVGIAISGAQILNEAGQTGDVAQVYSQGLNGVRFHLHSAVYLGCGYYLQRNGNSDIQISDQHYLELYAGKGAIRYIRPAPHDLQNSTFTSMLANLKAKVPPNSSIYNCFP